MITEQNDDDEWPHYHTTCGCHKMHMCFKLCQWVLLVHFFFLSFFLYSTNDNLQIDGLLCMIPTMYSISPV